MKSSNFSVRGHEQHQFVGETSEQLLYKSIFAMLVMAVAVFVLFWM